MTDATKMLDEFHGRLNDERGRGNAALRINLLKEEHDELIEALELAEDEELGAGSSVSVLTRRDIARELADLVYVAYGTAHAFAIDLDAAIAEVHRAALSKLDPATMVVRADGKVLKPPGFVPPNMVEAVR